MPVCLPETSGYHPSAATVGELLRRDERATVWTSFTDPALTALGAYERLRDGGPSFLLESAQADGTAGRFAYVGVRPRQVLRWSLGDAGDPYRLVAEATGRVEPGAGPPLPFVGGAVGLFGYDLVRTVAPLGAPPADELGLPDLAVMLTDVVVVLDATTGSVTVTASVGADEDPAAGHAAACRRIAAARRQLQQPGEPGPAPPTRAGAFRAGVSPDRYQAAVSRCVSYIEAGDAFQIVPSQRWSAPLAGDPLELYRALRTVNPSPHMFFLDFEDFQLVGASPEPLLQVRGGRATTTPIAGTRPRGTDAVSDRRLTTELLADEKERAEHIMLVDLGRNDLGRVCAAGSVRVERFMEVECYSHVMHLVSRVAGTLGEGVGPMDALRHVLPAGTLSGAPKVRAMQIIDELEPVKRGPYGGGVGWLGYDGDLDTAIVIRTAVIRDGQVHLQAGAGVVADSDPRREHQETVDKRRAVKRAVDIAAATDGEATCPGS